MADPINFNEARADKENDGTLWTPLECLKSAVRELEDGTLKPVDVIYIAMSRKDEKGFVRWFPHYNAGARRLELQGLLAQHLYDLCER